SRSILYGKERARVTDWTIACRAMVCRALDFRLRESGARHWEWVSHNRTRRRAQHLTSRVIAMIACGLAFAVPLASQETARADSSAGVRVCMGGDVPLGTNLDTTWVDRTAKWMRRRPRALPEPSRLLAPLVPMLNGADLVMVNLEGAVGDDALGDTASAPARKCTAPTRRCYALRMPASAAAALRHLR